MFVRPYMYGLFYIRRRMLGDVEDVEEKNIKKFGEYTKTELIQRYDRESLW